MTGIAFHAPHRPQRWSSTDKDATITVAAGSLGISGGGGGGVSWVSARTSAKLPQNQKLYFEATIVATGGNAAIGVMNANGSLANYGGADNQGVTYYWGGQISYAGAQTGTLGVPVAGNVICTAVDGSAGKIWFRIGSGNWNGAAIGSENPALNLGGSACPLVFLSRIMICFSSSSLTESLTLNGGSSAFAQTPPAGFRAVNSSAAI